MVEDGRPMALGLMDGGDTENGAVVKANPKPKQRARAITDKGKKRDQRERVCQQSARETRLQIILVYQL